METKLTRIAEVAKACPDEKFTSLANGCNGKQCQDGQRQHCMCTQFCIDTGNIA